MVQMENNNQESGVGNNSIEISNLGLNQRNIDSDVEMEEEDEEEVPKHLNTLNSSGGFLVVSPDKLSVQYTNVNMHGHDVGAIQANSPAPTRRLVYYFEMYVVDAGTKGQMSIGFTSENCKMTRQPGWDPNTYGYHADDGMLYRGQGKGEIFGPTYTSGDTVGGGINYASQEIFFTKNGKLVGKVHKDVKGPLFPTVAVHSQNEKVNVNFEQKPFVFDIKGFASEERLKQQKSIEKISLPPDVSHGIVRSYLIHYGYQDTLNSFDMESKRTLPPIPAAQVNGFIEQGDMYALDHRKIMRQLIRHGDISTAFGKLREWYPQIVQNDTSSICFLLHCQQFIELVQTRKLEEAVQYARAELAIFFGIQSMYPVLEDCIALLAYEEPSKSPVSYLLKAAQREVTADAVNTMILLTNPELKDSQNCMQSHLERLLRQLTACCLEKRALNGGQGESFQLRRVLQNLKGGTW